MILVAHESQLARVVAGRPAEMWTHPFGLGWLGTLVPLAPAPMGIAVRVLQASAVLALLGVWTRPALVVLAGALLYVFGAAQLGGQVLHDMHLFWFAALLAVATGRDTDALGMSAWSRGQLFGRPSVAAARALMLARLWLGLVYFFPGVHKLAAGRAWLSGEDLRGQLWFKWFEAGAAPWPRVDRAPLVLALGAVLVVLFELSMPLLVMSRRTRPVALLLGLGFHLGAGHFMNVLFPSLIACYVVLLPGDRLERLLRLPARGLAPARAPALAVLALAFTVPIAIFGALGRTQAFPFACYPTFADPPATLIGDVAVERAGRTYRLPLRRSQDDWALVWRLGGLYGDPIDPAALRAFAAAIVPPGAPDGPRTWLLEERSLDPDRYGDPPLRRRILFAE